MASENGWEPARLDPGSDLLIWKNVPGTDVTLQVMKGLPEVFLPAWAADWNAYLEPLRDADSASYTPTNSVATSNHLNGTACDLDWDNHPFQQRGSFNAAQMATIAEMEAFYEGWMFWAGRWDDPVDEMHSQMGYDTWNRNDDALNFIARKIRSDGFSTFRRGPLPAIRQRLQYPQRRDAATSALRRRPGHRRSPRRRAGRRRHGGTRRRAVQQRQPDRHVPRAVRARVGRVRHHRGIRHRRRLRRPRRPRQHPPRRRRQIQGPHLDSDHREIALRKHSGSGAPTKD
jgi:hypothetical protein